MLLKKHSKGQKEPIDDLRLSNTRLEIFPDPRSFTRRFIILAPQWDGDLVRKKPVFGSRACGLMNIAQELKNFTCRHEAVSTIVKRYKFHPCYFFSE